MNNLFIVLIFLFYFKKSSSTIQWFIRNDELGGIMSIEHFLLGMGVDIHITGSNEIGSINALVESGGYHSLDYNGFLKKHEYDTEWTKETRDSFNFSKILYHEWIILEQYPILLEMLQPHQRAQISLAILVLQQRNRQSLRKMPTKYYVEPGTLTRFGNLLFPKKSQDQEIHDILDTFGASTESYHIPNDTKNIDDDIPPAPSTYKPIQLKRKTLRSGGEFSNFVSRNPPNASDILGIMSVNGGVGGGAAAGSGGDSKFVLAARNALNLCREKAGIAPRSLMDYLSTTRKDIPREVEGKYSYVSFIKNMKLLGDALPEVKDLFKDSNDFAIWSLKIEAEIKKLTWKRIGERRRRYFKRMESSSSSDWIDITEEHFLTFGSDTSDTSCKDIDDVSVASGFSSSDDWSKWKDSAKEWSSSASYSKSDF